jgi:TP901 family phage tail tape measure protein
MATNTEKIVVQVVVQGDKDLKRLEGRTKTTTKSFAKMTAGVVGAVAAFRQLSEVISNSIRSFRDFEFQMAKVRAVTGASNSDFGKLTNTAKELGRTTFFTAQQVSELQTNFGKLGFSTREILDAQEATLLLATATDADLARAAIVAGASIRGFGLDASEAGRVVDVMAKAFTSSALDIEKFQTSMTKVAPIAAAAGISLEATTAVMGTLTDAGIEASIAGTSLRNIFLKMQDSSSDLSQFLGFTVNSADDLEIALKKLNSAGLENEQIMELVDLRQVAAFNTMIKGADRIGDLRDAFDNANGSAKSMSDIIKNTLEGDFKMLTSATEGLKIELVDRLGSGLRRIIQRLTKLFTFLSKNAEVTAKWVTTLVDVVKWIGLYRLGVLAATKATTAWRVATTLLNSSLAITRGALAKTGIGLLAVALGELAFRYLTASEDGEEFNKTQEKINKETEKQLQLSEEALKSMDRIGKKTQDETDAEEQAKRDARFAKEQEDLQNNFTEQMSKLKERLKNGLDTQEEFDEKAFAKEQLHLANMLGLFERYGKNTADINAQILDNELNRIQTVAEAEKDARQKQIDSTAALGQQLITLAGEDEKMQKIKKVGIQISTAAAIANNLEALSLAAAGAAQQSKLLFPANIVAMLSTVATFMSLFANIKALKNSFGDGGVVEYANGGMVHGRSHAQGGEKFAVGGRVVELEGGEAVINKRSTAMFRNQLSAMNSAGGGVKFADGGLLNMPSFSQQQFNALGQNQMMGAMGGSGKVVVVEADITDSQNTVSVLQAGATI